jgi:hypothetical protein
MIVDVGANPWRHIMSNTKRDRVQNARKRRERKRVKNDRKAEHERRETERAKR